MALIAARISVLRGRPPGFAAGTSGSITDHSASVMSLGNRPPSRRYTCRCCSVHIPRPSARSRGLLMNQRFGFAATAFGSGSKILSELRKIEGAVGRPLISSEEIDRIHSIWAAEASGTQSEGDLWVIDKTGG